MPKKRVRKPAKAAPPAARNPVARSLASPLFRNKAVPKPGLYKRRPKHPAPLEPDE